MNDEAFIGSFLGAAVALFIGLYIMDQVITAKIQKAEQTTGLNFGI